jgi:hypothetical protein
LTATQGYQMLADVSGGNPLQQWVVRLAYEAADAGLLSPDLAAGIRRVKGAKKFGVRMGNWLTAEQGRRGSAYSTGTPSGEYETTPW